MEQIIGFIIIAIAGAAFDSWSKHRKARQKARTARPVQTPRRVVESRPPVVPQTAVGQREMPVIERPEDEGVAAIEPPREEMMPPETEDDANVSQRPDLERWRCAIIDGEIIARRF